LHQGCLFVDSKAMLADSKLLPKLLSTDASLRSARQIMVFDNNKIKTYNWCIGWMRYSSTMGAFQIFANMWVVRT